jgi:hypothetical protein
MLLRLRLLVSNLGFMLHVKEATRYYGLVVDCT